MGNSTLGRKQGMFETAPVQTVQKHQFHEKQACVGKLSRNVSRQVKSLVFINLKLIDYDKFSNTVESLTF